MSPTSAYQGSVYTVTVTISDTQLSSTASFTVTVDAAPNSPPAFTGTIPAVTRSYGGGAYQVGLSSYFGDPNGDTLSMLVTYTIGANAPVTIPSGIFTLPSTYTLQIAPTSITDLGVYSMTVKVTDPLGLFATSTFTVTITNTAPSWLTISNWSMAKLSTFSLDMSTYISDPDGGPYSLSGSYTYNGGAAVTLPAGVFSFPTAGTLLTTSTSLADLGTYVITLMASDPGGLQTPT